LTVTASADKGCTVSMVVLSPSGSRVIRSFRPDFFLCRQSVRDAGKDYRNVLLGLNIGGVPSINSLNSLYNFQVNGTPHPFAMRRVVDEAIARKRQRIRCARHRVCRDRVSFPPKSFLPTNSVTVFFFTPNCYLLVIFVFAIPARDVLSHHVAFRTRQYRRANA
jgi:hypothetical protein